MEMRLWLQGAADVDVAAADGRGGGGAQQERVLLLTPAGGGFLRDAADDAPGLPHRGDAAEGRVAAAGRQEDPAR